MNIHTGLQSIATLLDELELGYKYNITSYRGITPNQEQITFYDSLSHLWEITASGNSTLYVQCSDISLTVDNVNCQTGGYGDKGFIQLRVSLSETDYFVVANIGVNKKEVEK